MGFKPVQIVQPKGTENLALVVGFELVGFELVDFEQEPTASTRVMFNKKYSKLLHAKINFLEWEFNKFKSTKARLNYFVNRSYDIVDKEAFESTVEFIN